MPHREDELPTDFESEYIGLLIRQYRGGEVGHRVYDLRLDDGSFVKLSDGSILGVNQWADDRTNADKEIQLIAGISERIFNMINSLRSEYDVDTAVGAQQDVLGRLLGVKRNGLDDDDYRLFLRMAIARNNAIAYVISDDFFSLQDAIEVAFPDSDKAWIEDVLDMTLLLYVIRGVTVEQAVAIAESGLIPSPQGVGYDGLIYQDDEAVEIFGVADGNDIPDDVDGFAELNANPVEGGELAELIEVT